MDQYGASVAACAADAATAPTANTANSTTPINRKVFIFDTSSLRIRKHLSDRRPSNNRSSLPAARVTAATHVFDSRVITTPSQTPGYLRPAEPTPRHCEKERLPKITYPLRLNDTPHLTRAQHKTQYPKNVTGPTFPKFQERKTSHCRHDCQVAPRSETETTHTYLRFTLPRKKINARPCSA